MTTTEELYQKGEGVRRRLFGEAMPTSASAAQELAPDFMHIVTEALFGEIWTRPALDIKSRSMITLASLCVLGREPQLRQHITGALNIGITKAQILEIFMQMAFYGGVPVALNAITVAKGVFDQQKTK